MNDYILLLYIFLLISLNLNFIEKIIINIEMVFCSLLHPRLGLFLDSFYFVLLMSFVYSFALFLFLLFCMGDLCNFVSSFGLVCGGFFLFFIVCLLLFSPVFPGG